MSRAKTFDEVFNELLVDCTQGYFPVLEISPFVNHHYAPVGIWMLSECEEEFFRDISVGSIDWRYIKTPSDKGDGTVDKIDDQLFSNETDGQGTNKTIESTDP